MSISTTIKSVLNHPQNPPFAGAYFMSRPQFIQESSGFPRDPKRHMKSSQALTPGIPLKCGVGPHPSTRLEGAFGGDAKCTP